MFCFVLYIIIIAYRNVTYKTRGINHGSIGSKKKGGGRFRFRFRPIRIYLLPESPVAVNRPPYSKQSPTLNMENLLWNKVSGLKKLPNEKKRESWELIDQSELLIRLSYGWTNLIHDTHVHKFYPFVILHIALFY